MILEKLKIFISIIIKFNNPSTSNSSEKLVDFQPAIYNESDLYQNKINAEIIAWLKVLNNFRMFLLNKK